ncbi:MAG: (d)CMP kinase [Sphingomonadaceae bacterium]
MIIAVDGPTASGKGTLAKSLARYFDLPHMDTGLLYRATGYQVALNSCNPDDPEDALRATSFPESLLDDPHLRDESTGALASRVSVHPQVRKALFERQRSFAMQEGGAILDGRDIGTVIAPDADVKLFVTASVAERARRRGAEMRSRGMDVTDAAIAADLKARDQRDSERKNAPLEMAGDALLLDTTDLSPQEALARAISWIQERMGKGAEE